MFRSSVHSSTFYVQLFCCTGVLIEEKKDGEMMRKKQAAAAAAQSAGGDGASSSSGTAPGAAASGATAPSVPGTAPAPAPAPGRSAVPGTSVFKHTPTLFGGVFLNTTHFRCTGVFRNTTHFRCTGMHRHVDRATSDVQEQNPLSADVQAATLMSLCALLTFYRFFLHHPGHANVLAGESDCQQAPLVL